MTTGFRMALAGAGALMVLAGPAAAQQAPMGFFITSAPLEGGNLGGLAGTGTARRWPRRQAPATAPGAPICRRKGPAR